MEHSEIIWQHLEGISVSITLFAATAIILIAILNFILKMRLINSGQTDPEVLKVLSNSYSQKVASLRWGIILLSGGIGLVLIYFIPSANQYESPLPYGIELIFIAIGFLAYYFVARNKRDE
ncbi:DUF6249 domain-containing protein [Mucilaginibacter auburnensis]|nr:DUF6249 domain-containing protein [Mucilaginibacter auburnensis]